MLKLYRDKTKTFEFAVQVEGASKIDSARLVLESDGSKFIYMLRGDIKADGKCSINIPSISESTVTKGKASLEVIADSVMFTPWKDDFSVASSIKVEVKNTDGDLIEPVKPKVTVEIKEPVKQSLTPLEAFKRTLNFYKALDEDNKKEMHDQVMNFKPSKELMSEVKQHKFGKNPNSFAARLYMYSTHVLRSRSK